MATSLRRDAILLLIMVSLATLHGCVEAKRNVTFTATDYANAVSKAILFFEGQRSGQLPRNQRVTWRGNSALFDGQPDKISLVGGYYDAGDNVKFVWPMSFTLTLLSWAAIEYEMELYSIGQMSYLQAAIQWGTDFIIKCHPSPSVLYTQIGDGEADHKCWERPEDMDTPRTLYKITPSNPGSEAASEASAALSSASLVFKYVDPNYSKTLLDHAQALFQFANNSRGTYTLSCPFYCSFSGYTDEVLWAAAWLYKATGSQQYLNFVVVNQFLSQTVNEFGWDNKYAGLQTLLAKEFYKGASALKLYKDQTEAYICSMLPGSQTQQIKTTPGGLIFVRDATNLQYASGAAMLMLFYVKSMTSNTIQCGSISFSRTQVRTFARSQVDYILGNNPLGISYMVGFGSYYPSQIHHRSASIPSMNVRPQKVGCGEGFSFMSSSQPNPNVHVGTISGGPNQNDQYKDSRSDYTHSEPTTYMNAAFVAAASAFVTSGNIVLPSTNHTAFYDF